MLAGLEQLACPELAVPMSVMEHVVRVESSFNPFAIGVVGGRLVRQPKTLPEALATVSMLEKQGYNFSLGLAQVNRYNLSSYGLASYQAAFQPCPNLRAGSRILAECRQRNPGDWGKAFSCYYSGNAITGFRDCYVDKVLASMRDGQAVRPGAEAIREADGRTRKRVAASSDPIHEPLPAPGSRAATVAMPVPASQAIGKVGAAAAPDASWLPDAKAPDRGSGARDRAFVF